MLVSNSLSFVHRQCAAVCSFFLSVSVQGKGSKTDVMATWTPAVTANALCPLLLECTHQGEWLPRQNSCWQQLLANRIMELPVRT